jgi:hypothetical protein
MRSHIGLLPQCLFIVRSRAKVNRLEESYVSRAAQRPLWVADSTGECNKLYTDCLSRRRCRWRKNLGSITPIPIKR